LKVKNKLHTIAKEYEVDSTTIEAWVRKYQSDGVNG